MTKKTWIAAAASLAAIAVAGGAYAAETAASTTRAEAQSHAVQMFARMDQNKDGQLDPADRAARQGAMFERLDANKDGAVSRAEFDAAHADREGPGGPGMGRHGDGPGHDGDKGPRMGRHGGGRGMHGMMMLGMADANKDGAVTQAEFSAAALAHFDKADANHDGSLTRAERRAAHEEMRKTMRERMDAPAPPPAT